MNFHSAERGNETEALSEQMARQMKIQSGYWTDISDTAHLERTPVRRVFKCAELRLGEFFVASLIENLIDVLGKEDVVYKELLELSRVKTEAIVSNQVDDLQDILGKEQSIISKLDALEKLREEHIGDIANVLNVPLDKMKIDLLIRMMEKQPKDQEALIKVHDSLKGTMDRLKLINDNNRMLLQESIDMLDFEMNLVRNSMMAPTTNNYGKSAYSVENAALGGGNFDAKQ